LIWKQIDTRAADPDVFGNPLCMFSPTPETLAYVLSKIDLSNAQISCD
jgi:hypothetical protein